MLISLEMAEVTTKEIVFK